MWVGWTRCWTLVIFCARAPLPLRSRRLAGAPRRFMSAASVVVTTAHLVLGRDAALYAAGTAWGLRRICVVDGRPTRSSAPSIRSCRFTGRSSGCSTPLTITASRASAKCGRRSSRRGSIEAQLQALQQQLHPHFLFNTLHAISTLVHREPDKADAMIERLSDLLRITLDKVGVQEVDAGRGARLPARLSRHRAGALRQSAADRSTRSTPHALDALVPKLILQPLVENAIRHGLEPRPGKVG